MTIKITKVLHCNAEKLKYFETDDYGLVINCKHNYNFICYILEQEGDFYFQWTDRVRSYTVMLKVIGRSYLSVAVDFTGCFLFPIDNNPMTVYYMSETIGINNKDFTLLINNIIREFYNSRAEYVEKICNT